ncbi:MAG: hypothetical protein RIC11_07705, partial [Botrimarina sp.]
MKHRVLAGWATLAVAGVAGADEVAQPRSIAPSTLRYDSYYAQPAETLPALADEATPPAPTAAPIPYAAPAAAPGVEPVSLHCDAPLACCGADACGGHRGCSGGGGCSLLGDCCLGDAYALKDCVDPCGCCPIDFGGWTQFGFHTDNIR